MILIAILINLSFLNNPSNAELHYPKTPHPSLTPGSLCEKPNQLRYAERIPYCERDVDSELKDLVVRRYDATFGYKVGRIGRHHFKIDHFIPLCMGGSNQEDNLWPQHPTVYEITDPLESALCEKLYESKIKQAEAIRLIKRAKTNLNEVKTILTSVLAL